MPGTHPDAELASYTDGSATDEERHLVEAHLAECSTCRADVEFAAQGRAAMQSLPDLGSPGLVDEGLGWLPQATPEPAILPVGPSRTRRDRAARRARRRTAPVSLRIAWGAGIAVAASLAAVFLYVSLNGGSQNATTAGRAAAPTAEAFGPVRSSKDYTPASIDALARTLARQGGFQAALSGPTAAPRPAAAPAAGGAALSPAAKSLDQNAAKEEASCLRSGASLGSAALPTYLEVATFQGKPAFVGAFRTGPAGASPTHLLVVAVDQVTCQPLYVVTLPL